MNEITVTLMFSFLMITGYMLMSPNRFRLVSLREERRLSFSIRAFAGRMRFFSLGSVLKKRKQELMDRAIFDAISFIRNLIAAQRGGKVSADLLLEQLSQTDSIIAPNFKRALTRLRMGRKEEMAEAFSSEIGTEAAQDLIRIILRWDQIDPGKLSSSLHSYQCAIKENRTTRIKRANETFSDLLYLPVILNVLLVLVNFLFVGYFIEQRELINQLFY